MTDEEIDVYLKKAQGELSTMKISCQDFCRLVARLRAANAKTGGNLTFEELREAGDARAALWHGGLKPDMAFAAIELGGEVGETLNAVKKLLRWRRKMPGGSDTAGNLADELADVVICADRLASALSVNLGAAVRGKFNATSKKHGFPQRLQPVSDAQEREEEMIQRESHPVRIARVRGSAMRLYAVYSESAEKLNEPTTYNACIRWCWDHCCTPVVDWKTFTPLSDYTEFVKGKQDAEPLRKTREDRQEKRPEADDRHHGGRARRTR